MAILKSKFIIDGAAMDASPEMMLESACGRVAKNVAAGEDAVLDETLDPSPGTGKFDKEAHYYLSLLPAGDYKRNFPVAYSETYSKSVICNALLDAIWKKGHFRLGDLELSAFWKWSFDKTGDAAAFYTSVASVCGWMDELGLKLDQYGLTEGDKSLTAKVSLAALSLNDNSGEEFFDELPFKTGNPVLENERICPETMIGQKDNWLVYVPFVPCAHKLGGSLLAEVTGVAGGGAPAIEDADYFIDCYEVVRELAEDGVVVAAVTVGEAGLMRALEKFCPEGGVAVDVGSISADSISVLFSAVPGVLLEVRDFDYDYIDAEFLLQDVAYYPIGHPSDHKGVALITPPVGGISGILQSLLGSQASEGED